MRLGWGLRIGWRIGVAIAVALALGGLAAMGPTSVGRAEGACPVAGQCEVNAATQCPKLGPLQPTPPAKCAPLPVTIFWITGKAPGGGCNDELIVQVAISPTDREYEAVVYATIGEGTRWWAFPHSENGPGWGPGEMVVNDAATYTVPAGYHAWQVGGGSNGESHGTCPTPGTDWVGIGAWTVSAPVEAGSGSIHVKGPTKNAFHKNFKESVYGTAHGAANYVISGEQLNPAGGCASTFTAESAKTDWLQWPTGTGHVHNSFSLVARFYAKNHGKHGICSYLINRTSNHTYAHAGLFWKNS